MPSARSLNRLDRFSVSYGDAEAVGAGAVDFAGWEAEIDEVVETIEEARADFAERLVRRFLNLCESPRTRKHTLGLVKGSMANAKLGRRVYTLINKTVVNPLARKAGVEASAMRLELVCSQLVGLAMMRYVLEVEPIASSSIDELVRRTTPSIRAALTA